MKLAKASKCSICRSVASNSNKNSAQLLETERRAVHHAAGHVLAVSRIAPRDPSFAKTMSLRFSNRKHGIAMYRAHAQGTYIFKTTHSAISFETTSESLLRHACICLKVARTLAKQEQYQS